MLASCVYHAHDRDRDEPGDSLHVDRAHLGNDSALLSSVIGKQTKGDGVITNLKGMSRKPPTEEQREKQRYRSRMYYWKNKEKVLAYIHKYTQENHATILRKKADYRASRRKELAQAEKARYHRKKNTPEFKSKAASYRDKNRENQREWSKKRSADVTEGYARELLSKHTPLPASFWPQQIVESKILQIKLNRAVRNIARNTI